MGWEDPDGATVMTMGHGPPTTKATRGINVQLCLLRGNDKQSTPGGELRPGAAGPGTLWEGSRSTTPPLCPSFLWAKWKHLDNYEILKASWSGSGLVKGRSLGSSEVTDIGFVLTNSDVLGRLSADGGRKQASSSISSAVPARPALNGVLYRSFS